MSVRQWYSGVLSGPLELIIGLFILVIAAAGGAIHHVENWSLWLGIKIIIMTVFRGLVHKNAY